MRFHSEGCGGGWRLEAVHSPRLMTDHGACWLKSGRRGEPVAFVPGQPRARGPSLGSAEHSSCVNLAFVQRGSPQGAELVALWDPCEPEDLFD